MVVHSQMYPLPVYPPMGEDPRMRGMSHSMMPYTSASQSPTSSSHTHYPSTNEGFYFYPKVPSEETQPSTDVFGTHGVPSSAAASSVNKRPSFVDLNKASLAEMNKVRAEQQALLMQQQRRLQMQHQQLQQLQQQAQQQRQQLQQAQARAQQAQAHAAHAQAQAAHAAHMQAHVQHQKQHEALQLSIPSTTSSMGGLMSPGGMDPLDVDLLNNGGAVEVDPLGPTSPMALMAKPHGMDLFHNAAPPVPIERSKVTLSLPDADRFQKTYQRNNKKGGKKHLRCFPYCGPQHNDTKQCIQTVRLNFTREFKKEQAELFAFASFFCVQDLKMGRDVNGILVEHVYPMDDVLQRVKSASEPLLPLFQGRMTWRKISKKDEPAADGESQSSESDTDTQIERGMFEFHERAWHYGWVGGRYRQDTDHKLRFYVFEFCRGPTPMLICKDILDSPTFRMYSSRFRYNTEKSAEKMIPEVKANLKRKRKIARILAESKVVPESHPSAKVSKADLEAIANGSTE